MNKKIIGDYGEKLACAYLERHGYQIKDQNRRLGNLELDLIAAKNGRVVIFEIKTRWRESFLEHDSLISRQQKLNLKKAAKKYAALCQINFNLLDFDLLLIIIDASLKQARVKHYQNIF